MIESLRRANRSSLQARLKGLLTEAQIEGVLKRRDILLAHVERLTAERGEQTVLFSKVGSHGTRGSPSDLSVWCPDHSAQAASVSA